MEHTKETNCPCKTCITYAICKLKKDIVCDDAENYCYNPDNEYNKYNRNRVIEIRDYLGKGAASSTFGNRLVFSDIFDHHGDKLN